jgi:Flagellar basal body L-ring protein
MNTLLRLMGCAALAVLATGCASINPPPPVDVLPTTLPPVATMPRPAGPATGSLFHAASFRPAFEDQRARLIGDLVTITIKEEIDAKQNSTSNVGRSSNTEGRITALPLVSSSLAAKLAGKTAIGAGYENTFEGKGDTLAKNDSRATSPPSSPTCCPTGIWSLRAKKQVGVNRSVDVLRFSGIVDPRRLAPGSVIDSRYVANVRVISRGMGEQAEAQAMGWLARAFNTVTPF